MATHEEIIKDTWKVRFYENPTTNILECSRVSVEYSDVYDLPSNLVLYQNPIF